MKKILSIVLLSTFVNLLSINIVTAQDSLIVRDVDRVPQFAGGIRGWNKFVSQNLRIDRVQEAMDSTMYVEYGKRQEAIIEFDVCEDGTVCNVVITNEKKVSPELAKSVYQLMKKTPKWLPAEKEGRAVRTRFKQPIVVYLEE